MPIYQGVANNARWVPQNFKDCSCGDPGILKMRLTTKSEFARTQKLQNQASGARRKSEIAIRGTPRVVQGPVIKFHLPCRQRCPQTAPIFISRSSQAKCTCSSLRHCESLDDDDSHMKHIWPNPYYNMLLLYIVV